MKYDEYKETGKRGTDAFPLQYYYVDREHPHYVMQLHWHAEFEIIRVIKGRLVLFLNNESYIGEPGAVFFVPPRTLHRADPLDCVYECAVFELKLISPHGSQIISEYIRPIMSGEVSVDAICNSAESAVGELFSSISVEREYYELSALSALDRIFFELYSSNSVKAAGKQGRAYANRRSQMILLLEKIGKEYTGRISLSDLADFSGINEKYLFRVFKEFTGQTPTEYINSLRIERACYEMTVNSMSVTEAAYESGFNELSYFSRIFKKYKGVTPGEYKRSSSSEYKKV